MRTASCTCGQLHIGLSGEPHDVLICHCRDCQKSTGAAFGVSTYWPKSAVIEIAGQSTAYKRLSDQGRQNESHFCPVCGSKVFWYAGFAPDSIGVALGNFDAADLPPPTDEYWTIRKYPWVDSAVALRGHERDD